MIIIIIIVLGKDTAQYPVTLRHRAAFLSSVASDMLFGPFR